MVATGVAVKLGMLIKGGEVIENLSQIDMVVFDKTGTLSTGVFKVTNVGCVDENEIDLEKVAEDDCCKEEGGCCEGEKKVKSCCDAEKGKKAKGCCDEEEVDDCCKEEKKGGCCEGEKKAKSCCDAEKGKKAKGCCDEEEFKIEEDDCCKEEKKGGCCEGEKKAKSCCDAEKSKKAKGCCDEEEVDDCCKEEKKGGCCEGEKKTCDSKSGETGDDCCKNEKSDCCSSEKIDDCCKEGKKGCCENEAQKRAKIRLQANNKNRSLKFKKECCVKSEMAGKGLCCNYEERDFESSFKKSTEKKKCCGGGGCESESKSIFCAVEKKKDSCCEGKSKDGCGHCEPKVIKIQPEIVKPQIAESEDCCSDCEGEETEPILGSKKEKNATEVKNQINENEGCCSDCEGENEEEKASENINSSNGKKEKKVTQSKKSESEGCCSDCEGENEEEKIAEKIDKKKNEKKLCAGEQVDCCDDCENEVCCSDCEDEDEDEEEDEETELIVQTKKEKIGEKDKTIDKEKCCDGCEEEKIVEVKNEPKKGESDGCCSDCEGETEEKDVEPTETKTTLTAATIASDLPEIKDDCSCCDETEEKGESETLIERDKSEKKIAFGEGSHKKQTVKDGFVKIEDDCSCCDDSEPTEKLEIIIQGESSNQSKVIQDMGVIFDAHKFSVEKLLYFTASAESNSEHSIAKIVLQYAKERGITTLSPPDDFRAFPGRGIKCVVDGIQVIVGNLKWMNDCKIPMSKLYQDKISGYEKQGHTVVVVSLNKQLAGWICVQDTIKHDAPFVVQSLKNKGIKVGILSGDNQSNVENVAKELGIEFHQGELFPDSKATHINNLKNDGFKVAMVGDGINDTVALTTSNVGIAIKGSTSITMDCADVILLHDDLQKILVAIDLSNTTVHRIWMNFFWAFLYNVIGIPLACGMFETFGVYISPSIAGLSELFSSLPVILFSLALYLYKPPKKIRV